MGGAPGANETELLLMPRYFFHAVNGQGRQEDTTGIDLPGDQAAFDHGVAILQALWRSPSGKRAQSHSIEVRESQGYFLFAIPLDLPIIRQDT